jgi:hypothetical protein
MGWVRPNPKTFLGQNWPNTITGWWWPNTHLWAERSPISSGLVSAQPGWARLRYLG